MCRSERPRLEFNITEEEAAELERRRKICCEVRNHLVSVFRSIATCLDRLDDSDLDKVQRLLHDMDQVTARAKPAIHWKRGPCKFFNVPQIPDFLFDCIEGSQTSGDITVICCLLGRFGGKDVYDSCTGAMFTHDRDSGIIEHIGDPDIVRELFAGHEEVAKLKGVLAAKG